MTCLIKIRKLGSGDELACCYVGVQIFNNAYGMHYEELPKNFKSMINFSGHLPDHEEWFFGFDVDIKSELVPIKALINELDSIANELARFQK
jgi:hypothetical protein